MKNSLAASPLANFLAGWRLCRSPARSRIPPATQARCQNVKMVPFDVVTGVFDVISNGRRVIIFQKGLKMFLFPVVESSLRFPDVKIIAVPATSFIDDFG